MQDLTFIKVLQKFLSFREIVAEAREAYNPFLLLSNVSFAFGDVPLGFIQMTKLHRAKV